MSRTLKFRLTDNNIFEFKYSKYSEFIDNLEPEPGVIIDVLEPFTLEHFETAQNEYNKYIVFKEALEDIITTRKLWSKKELMELSKYDLNNPVLEWLMIMETREDKEIKEKSLSKIIDIFFDSIKFDSIIQYYIIDFNNQTKFNWACKNGHLKAAQWLYLNSQSIPTSAFYVYEIDKININYFYDLPFKRACENGHLEVAQWIYSIGIVEFPFIFEYVFRLACENGHLEVAQWLYSLRNDKVNIRFEYLFGIVCEKGYLEVAQWLYSLGGIEKEIIYSISNPICIKWLNSLKTGS